MIADNIGMLLKNYTTAKENSKRLRIERKIKVLFFEMSKEERSFSPGVLKRCERYVPSR